MTLEGRKFRNELKYYLNIRDYFVLRQKVAALLTLDKNSLNEEGYNIRSLYFDGRHDHALYDKNNGVFSREKYRIRIYNGSDEKISLERKSKYGDFISKESAPLSLLEYKAIINGESDVLAKKEHPLLRDFYAALKYRAFLPRVIVDYVREAYIYELGNVRVTFDKKLAAGINDFDLFNKRMVYEEILLPEQTILEVKFDQFLPDNVRKIVQPDQFVRSAISKYVICRETNIQHFNQ